MKKHDWRGGSETQFCGNAGCPWVRLMGGVPGDKRIRYRRQKGAPAILKPHPCEGLTAEEVRREK